MALQADVNERIDRRIYAISATIPDVVELATQWDRLSDDERASFSLDWDHLMGDYLTELDEHARAGRMTAKQRAEYATLLAELARTLPLIERLNLYRPPVSLEPPQNLKIATG
jgi:hypothetical protein